ncbi:MULTISPECIES: hypothetical protein [unclassified Arthrobacter]|uniref:hypothetical protein n=1 Tax=unclassified Arthrobacter TaxID=235627 RepID=UPI002DF9F645|nr:MULTISPECIES: hypothetical protein [unclassified Arthrobacter]MEC5193172.1 hypothetical protein [Arthrobacter sp. MP_M4]MEC5202467.1 hypothetical protein [Arthrobacter sp. MP_M7]
MTSPYNRGGSISSDNSREHIERALRNYGATEVRFSQQGNLGAIAFRGEGRQFRVVLSFPQQVQAQLTPVDTAQSSTEAAESKNRERSSRRSWHALAAAIDAKLGLVAAGAGTLESEFLAHVVLPGNRTVFEELQPVIDSAYHSGRQPSFNAPVVPDADTPTPADARAQ